MSDLPPGWAGAPVKGIANVQLGRQRSPKNHIGSNMRPYLRAANVTWNGLALDDVKYMHFSSAELTTFRLAPGDILLSEASGSASQVGKPAMWRGEIEDCYFQNTLIRVRTKLIEPRYLLWFFKWLALSGQFARSSRGVGIHHLGAKTLSEWTVPIAPIREQKRIVAAIEEQFSRVDVAEAALVRVRRGLKQMRAAVLEVAATGQLADRSDDDVDKSLRKISADRREAWHAVTKKPYREPAIPAQFYISIPGHWRITSLEAITHPMRVICYGILMPRVREGGEIPYVEVKDLRAPTLSVGNLHRTTNNNSYYWTISPPL